MAPKRKSTSGSAAAAASPKKGKGEAAAAAAAATTDAVKHVHPAKRYSAATVYNGVVRC